ncbi:eosinophil peroxidase isoform X1 [Brienomyrus brachyistius]|uniref:eosinophil peroxidase isoform X1 n=1 Tax=Brienomyrus brachyistius TaxID=42636 RepID=UPI0020B2D2CE|nr:eosinophil peroxidase isoform X1 [Brienomyrus brachyistius]
MVFYVQALCIVCPAGGAYPGSKFLQEALRRATELTNAAYAHTRERVKILLSEGSLSPSDLLSQFKHAGPRTRTHVRAAELLDTTVELIREMVYTHTMTQHNFTDLLSGKDMDELLHATGCSAELRPPLCETDCLSNRYRTITGECNNRQHPLWGAANTPYTRWLPPQYQDGRAVPRGWDLQYGYHNFALPPVRAVSQQILYTQNEDISLDSSLSHLLVEWGQWIDHDLVLTPQTSSKSAFRTGVDCTHTCSRDTPCFPIQIPSSDPRASAQSCMPFFRSAPSCQVLPLCHREQLNAITSFVDASMVYGSTEPLASVLRNHSSPFGLLAHNLQHSDQGLAYMPYLPRQPSRPDPCGPRQGLHSTDLEPSADLGNFTSCFQAGDTRANEHLGMIALHTLFLREHNRLAQELHLLNPHWSPDTLYQEARKILGAVHQVLTWNHYLPRVLGQKAHLELLPPYHGYQPDTDPSIANAFATAAFRFAHVTVHPVVNRLDHGYHPSSHHPPLPLHLSLFASWRVMQEGGIDPVLRGLLLYPAKLQTPGQMMVEELTERLFQAQGGLPLDLGALNLQRGRDHGLPGYSAWRQLCDLSVPTTVTELAGILGSAKLAQKLLHLYGTPHNIDLWVGAISEPALPGGRVGPLLSCLLGKQFRALRDGDRFWWEREEVFTGAQRAELRRVSLSRIICDNTRLGHVPPDPFAHSAHAGDMVPCSHPLIPSLNLSAWREPDTDPRCGSIPRLQFGFSLLCGSVQIYQCQPGYALIGPASITCDPSVNQWSQLPPTCQDVDECAQEVPPCPVKAQCVNTPGSYTCTEIVSPEALSVRTLVVALATVIVAILVTLLMVTCYRRSFIKNFEPFFGGCCQSSSLWPIRVKEDHTSTGDM